jgi:hypothetical protein
MPAVRRLRRAAAALAAAALLSAIAGAGAGSAVGAPAATAGSVSHSALWQALGGKVHCGLTVGPVKLLLCSSRAIPAPKGSNAMEGDPGFAFLGKSGRPKPARLSQNTWVGAETFPLHQVFVRLGAGRTWSSSALRISCSIRRTAVRCTNRAGHGYTLTRSSYRAF